MKHEATLVLRHDCGSKLLSASETLHEGRTKAQDQY